MITAFCVDEGKVEVAGECTFVPRIRAASAPLGRACKKSKNANTRAFIILHWEFMIDFFQTVVAAKEASKLDLLPWII